MVNREDQHHSLQVIGKYRIIGTLGRGSMGVVYKAQDPEIGRIVAIKTLRNISSSKRRGTDTALERFRIEARSAGNLRHPNLITVFEVSIDGEFPYIVMDYVEGEGVDVVLHRLERFSPEVALHYLKQAADGIDAAHKQGVIHRDIKPSNMIIDKHDNLFIVDFGVACINENFSDSDSRDEPIMGTPAYMSPEQILNKDLDHRSDLFSLAVVGFEFFAGTRPFPGKNFHEVLSYILNATPIALSSLVDLPLALEAEFERALSKDKNIRFKSANEMIRAFAAALGIERIEKPAASERKDPEKGPLRKRKLSEWRSLSRPKESGLPHTFRDGPQMEKKAIYAAGDEVAADFAYSQINYEPNPNVEGPAEHHRDPGSLWAHVKAPIGAPDGSPASKPKPKSNLPRIKATVMVLSCLCLLASVGLLFYELILNRETESGGQPTPQSQDSSQSKKAVGRGKRAEKIPKHEEFGSILLPEIAEVPVGKMVTEMDDKQVLGLIVNGEQYDPKDVVYALREASERGLFGLVGACSIAINHPNYIVRTRVVKTLVKAKDPNGAKVIVAVLDDHDPAVRKTAAIALGQMGSHASLGYLTNRLAKEDNDGVRASLVAAIEKINGYPMDLDSQ